MLDDPQKLAAFLKMPELRRAIQEDALKRFPEESCGAVTPDGFVPLPNASPAPLISFDCSGACAELQRDGKLLAVVHSHPNGPEGPSRWDMQFAATMEVPWGLVALEKDRVGEVFFWGDQLPVPPLEGRGFRHGPSGTDGKGDCYALIRDWYRVERQIDLPDFPRSDLWWEEKDGPNDLYRDNFAAAGFRQIEPIAPQPGDVILCSIRSRVPNHGAVYLGNGLMIHHLHRRLSQIVPVGPWQKMIRMWLRREAA